MTPETSSTIQTIVISVVLPALAGILWWIGKYVCKWFEVKTAKLDAEKARIEAEQKQSATEFGLKRLDHIVSNVVAQAEQEKPSGIKPSATENATRLSAAQDEVKAQVQPAIMAAVATVVKDPEKYITTKIEAAVIDLKIAKAESIKDAKPCADKKPSG
jgi:hypothetical protein